MNKFKVGDKVVCNCAEFAGDVLEEGKTYTVKTAGITIELEQIKYDWSEARFELLSEWASHQKPVNTETELSLTKLQVKSLQDWKKDALYLLSKTSHEDMIPTTLREEIDYFLVNNKLEGFDE